jgi:hypothetical protein
MPASSSRPRSSAIRCGCITYSASALRDVELTLAERGGLVTHESISHWCHKFGAEFAKRLWWRRPPPGNTRHLDEAPPVGSLVRPMHQRDKDFCHSGIEQIGADGGDWIHVEQQDEQGRHEPPPMEQHALLTGAWTATIRMNASHCQAAADLRNIVFKKACQIALKMTFQVSPDRDEARPIRQTPLVGNRRGKRTWHASTTRWCS